MHAAKKLSFSQEDLKIIGHSVEVRVYAEDPCNNFLPDIGKLATYRTPQGLGIRVDDGFEEGMDIPIYYDPMIAKLITFGKNREEAINRMVRAIDDYQITGVETTLKFCKYVLKHEAFTSGNFDTHFVKKYFTPDVLNVENDDEALIAALLGAKLMSSEKQPTSGNILQIEETKSNWKKNRLLA